MQYSHRRNRIPGDPRYPQTSAILEVYFSQSSQGILMLILQASFCSLLCHSSRSGVTEVMLVRSMGRLRPSFPKDLEGCRLTSECCLGKILVLS